MKTPNGRSVVKVEMPTAKSSEQAATSTGKSEVEAQSISCTESSANSAKSWMRNPWRAHTRKIFLACGIVVIPMIAFTIAIIWVVFANLINENRCPYPELCPGRDILNASSKHYYYVDYPAARLVFISSWSSTVSLSFVGMLMTLFGYLIASQMLRTSSAEQSTRLPSPYQTSILMRVLNADLFALWDLGTNKVKAMFWKKEKSNDSGNARSPPLLRSAILVFLFCLFGSILVQAADTYLHIVTESANFVQIQTQDTQQHHYSRGLAPWCRDRPRKGSGNNVNYWGCGITFHELSGSVVLSNMTSYNAIEFYGPKTIDSIYNYTDSDGLQFALVGPHVPPAENDWKATTIGVSTQCSAIPPSGCTRDVPYENDLQGNQQAFNCSIAKGAPLDVSGNITGYMHEIHYFDFHKYLRDENPFKAKIIGWNDSKTPPSDVSDDEEVFKNPWKTLSQATIEVDRPDYPEELNDTSRLWPDADNNYDYTMLLCETTVWDIIYTAVGHEVTSVTATKSNGSVAGIVSLPGLSALMFIPNQYGWALQTASASATSMDTFIDAYGLGLSKIRTYSLATQMSPRPALLTQTRTSKVITKVPVAALWLLVLANVLYSLLGLALATMALIYTTPSVHQVYTRLSVTVIVAQLFEREYAERAVESEEKLFRENVEKGAEVKRVGVRRTDTGGSLFAVSEKSSRRIQRALAA
ncbi:hypothetical protein PMIN07_001393 [Paraphaeosphaeria minitans]